jgi:hypothetical protein
MKYFALMPYYKNKVRTHYNIHAPGFVAKPLNS